MGETEGAELEKMGLESKDLVAERVEEMKALFPEIASEDGIDLEKLRLILGGEVEDGDERYAFTWPGKRDAIRQSQTVSTAALRPCEGDSVAADGTPGSWEGTENLYIEGDNLEVLKLLQASYHGKVKLIYIDPPYNTGHDFVYEDSFGDTVENYKRQTAQADQSNPETAGRYHANWCSMMYPRLRLARELLSANGVIFISIDDNEVVNLRKICDEVFGESCFVSQLVWKSRQNKDNRTVTGVSVDHEYILVYSKTTNRRVLRGSDRDSNSYKNPDNDPRGPWASANMVGLATASARPNLHYDLINPATGINYGCPDKGWRYDGASMSRLINQGLIIWPDSPTGRPRRKKYLAELSGDLAGYPSIIGSDIYTRDGSNEIRELFEGSVFDFPKPTILIQELINQATGTDDLILDFFSGSASTAQAVMSMNVKDGGRRRFILAQLPEPCIANSEPAKFGFKTLCDIGKERIRRAGKKITAEFDEANQQFELGRKLERLPDIGFRVLRLDESGIIRPEGGQLLMDVVRPDRTDLDVIFECMLKWGLELSLPVERAEAAGYPVYTVAAGELVCCMERGLTVGALEAVAAMEPRRVLILDSALDDTLKLNAKAIFDRGTAHGTEIELRTV